MIGGEPFTLGLFDTAGELNLPHDSSSTVAKFKTI